MSLQKEASQVWVILGREKPNGQIGVLIGKEVEKG